MVRIAYHLQAPELGLPDFVITGSLGIVLLRKAPGYPRECNQVTSTSLCARTWSRLSPSKPLGSGTSIPSQRNSIISDGVKFEHVDGTSLDVMLVGNRRVPLKTISSVYKGTRYTLLAPSALLSHYTGGNPQARRGGQTSSQPKLH